MLSDIVCLMTIIEELFIGPSEFVSKLFSNADDDLVIGINFLLILSHRYNTFLILGLWHIATLLVFILFRHLIIKLPISSTAFLLSLPRSKALCPKKKRRSQVLFQPKKEFTVLLTSLMVAERNECLVVSSLISLF